MRLLLLLCLALVAVGVAWFQRKSPGRHRAVAGLLILLVAVFALTSLRRNRGHPDLFQAPVYERSVGYALGQAAIEAFPEGGEVLVIRLRFDKPWAKIKADGYVSGLEQGLKGSSLKIAGVEPDSIFEGSYIGLDEPVIPLPDLLTLLEKYEDVVGVISFCGFPQVRINELPEDVPPLFVAGTHSLRHGNWLQSKRAFAMVMGRPDVAADVDLSEDRPLGEVFDAVNYLVTPDNLLEIANELSR